MSAHLASGEEDRAGAGRLGVVACQVRARACFIKPGDSAWGTDWLGESKVPSPLRASAPPPGCQRMGHTHGFGSTEEPLRRTVFGCRERGLPSGPRFDHTTGEGHVPFHKGDYHATRCAARTTRSRCSWWSASGGI